ncbi:STAG2 protein, partial [Polypterus senegalus]
MPGPYWKKFKCNFCEFIVVLVRQCQYSIIYDSYLMDTVISLLTELSDSQQPEVRLKCIQGLHGVYSDKHLISKLDLFTSRFKERIISMASDKDPEVAVHTMKLLVLISQNCDDVLTTEDCKNLCLFVYSSHRPLAAAAGEFLYGKLLSYSPQQEQDERKTAKEQNITVITSLLQFFHTSEYSVKAENVANLLQIPQYFDTDVYRNSHLEKGEGQSASKEVNHQLLSTLKRITAFHNAHDLCHWDLYKSIFRLLSDGSQQVEPSHQVIVQALQCAFYAILWQLNRCFEGITSKAFLVVCDLLIACNCQFHSGETVDFTPFVLIPDSEMQAALLGFVQVHVFTDEDQQRKTKGSDITEDSSKLNNLHKRRTLLASYCKLVVNGIVEMNGAAEIFKQYMKYYNDFGDIIKETLSRTRQIDKIQSARTLALCLQQLFLEVKNEQGICNYSGSSSMHTLTTIRELARRFSLTFGWDQIKSRESIAMMHKDGIEFVFKGFIQNGGMPPPPNIAFLTILSEFSNRLLKPDKKTVYDYLQRYTSEQSVTLKDNGWHPLVCYRTSLLACGEADDLCSVLSCDTPGEPLPINSSRASSLKRNLSDVYAVVVSPKIFISVLSSVACGWGWSPAGMPEGTGGGLVPPPDHEGAAALVGARGHRQVTPQCLKNPGAQHFRHTRKCWGKEDWGHLEGFRVRSRNFRHTGACPRRNAGKQLEPIRGVIKGAASQQSRAEVGWKRTELERGLEAARRKAQRTVRPGLWGISAGGTGTCTELICK